MDIREYMTRIFYSDSHNYYGKKHNKILSALCVKTL